MKNLPKRYLLAVGLLVFLITATFWVVPDARIAAATLPKEIGDETFWELVTDLSEPGGFFRSDNFVSNERDFQYVVAELKTSRSPGGVYLGVGPDQNFTYIVALEPQMAFIIDIRRQNMLQHLMYKALLELSKDRADFLSMLFSRPRPQGLTAESDADTLLQAYLQVVPDRELFHDNLQEIIRQLVERHRFQLAEEDIRSIEYVYTAFFEGGPNLTYTFSVGQGANSGFGSFRGNRGMPTYAQLMMSTDQEGHNRSYLASSDNFRILQELHRKNLVVPLVGDFAGDKAVRAVGTFLKNHDAVVTAFYTSNVEQYLFQNDVWRAFYRNVMTLPLDSNSTFIRSVASGRRYQTPGSRASLLSPMQELLDAFDSGRIDSYSDVIRMSH